jgi:N-acetylglutamate synthase and related acetyltransferases
MPIAVPRVGVEDKPLVQDVRVEDLSALVIRSATVRDVHGMSALINHYASSNVMLARGPQYLYQHIQDYMVATAPRPTTGMRLWLPAALCMCCGKTWRKYARWRFTPCARRRALAKGWWPRWLTDVAILACRGFLPLLWLRRSFPSAVSASLNAMICPPLCGLNAVNAPSFTAVTKLE